MYRVFIIGGCVLEVQPPSVKNLSLAGKALGELSNRQSIEDVLNEKSKKSIM